MLRPFIKWVGGKGQLLEQLRRYYPRALGKEIKKYAEPFVGGGAVLFDILSRYGLSEIYISDINASLINTYRTIREHIDELIDLLETYQDELDAQTLEERKVSYYEKRDLFNRLKFGEERKVESAALFIYLNRTCFNGLYRVNRKGLFNVPCGAYKKPVIFDRKNLLNVSRALQNVEIVCADYRASQRFIDDKTFVYFDPPYRPLSKTSSFTSYTEFTFEDKEQIELGQYIRKLNNRGAIVLASNSDPKNTNPDDDFFEELYADFKIERVDASRAINSNADARGKIKELVIFTNHNMAKENMLW